MKRLRREDAAQKKYGIYARVSTDEQAKKDFTSVEVQVQLCRAYIAAKGANLDNVYSDEGKSGTVVSRPGLQKLISDVKGGLINCVVVTYMHRLGRGEGATVAEYLLKEAGASVEYVKQDFGTGMGGWVNKSVTKLSDGMFVESVRESTKTKMEAMVERGYFCGGTLPFGYVAIEDVQGGKSRENKSPKRLMPLDDQAEIVRQAYQSYINTGSMAEVGRYLRSVTDRPWVTDSIKYLLTNETYLGHQVFGAWRNDSAHPPVVASDVFQAVQDALDTYSPRQANGLSSFVYYLRGKMFCPYCSSRYTHLSVNRNSTGQSKRVHYYACGSANKGRSKCPVTRVNAEALHSTILSELARVSAHHTVMHEIIAKSGGWGTANKEQLTVRGQLAKRKQYLDMQAANYLKAIGEGRNSSYLLNALEKVELERNNVVSQLISTEAAIAAATVKRPTAAQLQRMFGQIVDLWADLTEDERCELLAGIVRRIDVRAKDRVWIEFVPLTEGMLAVEGLEVTSAKENDRRFSPIGETHGHLLALTQEMGAGVGLEPTTFGL